MFTREEDVKDIEEKRKYPVLHKHDVISCLGMAGKWITSQSELQVNKRFYLYKNCRFGMIFNEPASHQMSEEFKLLPIPLWPIGSCKRPCNTKCENIHKT